MPSNGKRVRVYIIDDDSAQLELVRRSLSLEGFEVGCTSSSIGATNLVRDFKPDVVLLDVNIPALSGDRLLGLARKAAPEARFFLFSASDESRLRQLAVEVKADGWLSKSTPVAELARRIQQAAAPT